MSKRKTATWFKRNGLFVVRPPDWPKRSEYTCSDLWTMIEWARGCGYVLKEVSKLGGAT